ncbi:MAG: sel1 repeat family protein [Alphaproteobacteria bacterium]|nr:sel1 repeat family protein [Alphaproteobacteria bacterium]
MTAKNETKNLSEHFSQTQPEAEPASAAEAFSRALSYYADGRSGEEYAKAAAWFEQAAQEIPLAQAYLADCYLFGCGVEQNDEKALSLLEQAAEKDVARALLRLGMLYANGDIVEADQVLAAKYFIRGIDCGENASAEEFLVELQQALMEESETPENREALSLIDAYLHRGTQESLGRAIIFSPLTPQALQ